MHTLRTKLTTPVVTVAIVIAILTATGASSAVASASPSPSSRVHVINGTFVDPGATITNITPQGDDYTFDLAGGTNWAGNLTGDTTYTGPGRIDTATGIVHAVLHEHFSGTLAGVGPGHLDCLDLLTSNPDGSGEVDCIVVHADGGLRGQTGLVRFAWSSTAPDGVVTGTMSGVLVG